MDPQIIAALIGGAFLVSGIFLQNHLDKQKTGGKTSDSGDRTQKKQGKALKRAVIFISIALLAGLGGFAGFRILTPKPVVSDRFIVVKVNGDIIDPKTDFPALPGTKISISAFPEEWVKTIVVKFRNQEPELYNDNTCEFTFQEDLILNYDGYMELNVKYKDGLYLDGNVESKTQPIPYLYHIQEFVKGKSFALLYDDKPISPNEPFTVHTGDYLRLHAEPELYVDYIWSFEANSGIENICQNNDFLQMSKSTGERTYYFNVKYKKDGLFLEHANNEKDSALKYIIKVVP